MRGATQARYTMGYEALGTREDVFTVPRAMGLFDIPVKPIILSTVHKWGPSLAVHCQSEGISNAWRLAERPSCGQTFMHQRHQYT